MIGSRDTNAIPDYNWSEPLIIGQTATNYFIGDIDEVRIYDRALTDNELFDINNDAPIIYLDMESLNNEISPIVLKNKEYYTSILEDIKKANKKIYLYIYDIEYGPEVEILLNELVNAKKRGVDIRIMLDSSKLSAELKQFLIDNDLQYKTSGIHAKVVVIDDYVYIGSHNWKQVNFVINNDLSIKTNNTLIVYEAEKYLNKLWNNKGILAFYDDGALETFLTKGYYETVLNKIENAKDNIKIIMWRTIYTDDNPKTKALWNAVKDAKDRGVDVKVILDDDSDASIREFLKDNDIQAKLDPSNEQKTHAKTVIVDDTVFISSANWEDPFFGTGDVTIKIRDDSIIDKISNYFNDLWISSNRNI